MFSKLLVYRFEINILCGECKIAEIIRKIFNIYSYTQYVIQKKNKKLSFDAADGYNVFIYWPECYLFACRSDGQSLE